jgi:8-oxo-dGTP pyrophosphatase MutT (NUDIX family)
LSSDSASGVHGRASAAEGASSAGTKSTAGSAASGKAPILRPIIDPTLARIDERSERLEPVRRELLQPQSLRHRFSQPPRWSPEMVDDRVRMSIAEPRVAAVLIAVVTRDEGPTVVLTKRTAHLSSHAGQIAFPGGRTEPFDASPAATALREAHEEIGLEHRLVEVLGTLPDYRTGTGFIVTPVVGLVDPLHSLRLDPNEVEDAFEVPLAFLMDPSNHQRRIYRWGDVDRMFFAMPWRSTQQPDREYFIWGATAAMLRNLYRFLSA